MHTHTHIYTHLHNFKKHDKPSVDLQHQTCIYQQVCYIQNKYQYKIHKYTLYKLHKYEKFTSMQTCNIHKYGNIFKYQYTQVTIYNMCDIYKTQKQRNYRNANSIKTPIPGNNAILLKAVFSGSRAKT